MNLCAHRLSVRWSIREIQSCWNHQFTRESAAGSTDHSNAHPPFPPFHSGTLGLLKQHDAELIGKRKNSRISLASIVLALIPGSSSALTDVPVDTAGLRPDALEDTLANWSTKYPNKRFPKLLYTMYAAPPLPLLSSPH